MAITFPSKKILALAGIACVTAFFALVSVTHSQTVSQPQMIITWQAQGSYVPPGYHDKALPNVTSNVIASLALISGGQLINLANQTIYWYENDTLIGGGSGIRSVSFSPFGGAPNFVTLKAEIPSYNGNLLVHAIQIPVVQPKAVIEAGHPAEQFGNSSLTLQGTPYFFNVSDPTSLSYAWSVNGASPATAINPQTLELGLGPNVQSGSTFATSLVITDPQAKLVATDSTNLTYVKQL